MTKDESKKKLLVVSLDGWGYPNESEANVFNEQRAPYLSSLFSKYPCTQLVTKARELGFKEAPTTKEMGHQALVSNVSYEEVDWLKSDDLAEVIKQLKKGQGVCHVLLSVGEQIDWTKEQLRACVELARRKKLAKLCVHAVLAGRISQEDWQDLEEICSGQEAVRIVSVMGSVYGLNDQYDWQKTKEVYEYLTEGLQKKSDKEWREFLGARCDEVTPSSIGASEIVAPKDMLLLMVRDSVKVFQLASAFSLKNFSAFTRNCWEAWSLLSLGRVADGLPIVDLMDCEAGLSLEQILHQEEREQIWITEAYGALALNYYAGGRLSQEAWSHDYRVVNSPLYGELSRKPVAGSELIVEEALEVLEEGGYEMVWVSLPALDLAGQVAGVEGMKVALTELDELLDKLITKAMRKDYGVFLTASCARSEAAVDLVTGQDKKLNSDGLVPLVILAKELEGRNLGDLEGGLSSVSSASLLNVAPTILQYLGIEAPEPMKSESLL